VLGDTKEEEAKPNTIKRTIYIDEHPKHPCCVKKKRM